MTLKATLGQVSMAFMMAEVATAVDIASLSKAFDDDEVVGWEYVPKDGKHIPIPDETVDNGCCHYYTEEDYQGEM